MMRIPVISAAQSGGMAATRSGARRPGAERSDAGHRVICHTPGAMSRPPAFSAGSRRSA
jgi:hypothetical protein